MYFNENFDLKLLNQNNNSTFIKYKESDKNMVNLIVEEIKGLESIKSNIINNSIFLYNLKYFKIIKGIKQCVKFLYVIDITFLIII